MNTNVRARVARALAGAVLVIAGGIVAAPTAHAADLNLNCSVSGSSGQYFATGGTFSIAVTTSSPCTFGWNYTGPNPANSVTIVSGGIPYSAGSSYPVGNINPVVAATASPRSVALVFSDGSISQSVIVVFPSSGGGGGGTPSGTGTSDTPAPVLQQVGLPAAGTCDDTVVAELSWGREIAGGWSRSWAEWSNRGAGGAVCTRSLVYSMAAGGWTVG